MIQTTLFLDLSSVSS